VPPLRLVPTGKEPIFVSGLHSYFGSIEIRSASDGLVLVNELPLERYLLGLDEVPPQWPVEALRAQAVAARTYALWTLGQPRGGAAAVYGFDICASTDCQVFSGADVVGTLLGERWADAVRDTAGETVLFEGEPILARYHSVSGGHTFANEQIFTDEGAYPYLKGVSSPTEGASPLDRWTVSFPLRHVQTILERAGSWGEQGRLRRVAQSGEGRPDTGPLLTFVGTNGRVRLEAQDFREAAGEIAPTIWPQSYPAFADTGTSRMPETLPSNRVAVRMRKKTLVVEGRGWGHGVGMSQWGAEGLARRGAIHEEILEHYYTGVSVGSVDEPRNVGVGIDWARSSVTVSGGFRIVDGRGRDLVSDALGTWTFGDLGSGSVGIDPPPGHGLPLRVGFVKVPKSVEPGEFFDVRAALSRPARVTVSTDERSTGPLIKERGVVALEVEAPEEAGEFEVRIDARGGGSRSSDTRSFEVEEAIALEPPSEPGSSSPPWLIAFGIAAVLAALFYAIVVTMRR
jgi:stage II sporulation protein D